MNVPSFGLQNEDQLQVGTEMVCKNFWPVAVTRSSVNFYGNSFRKSNNTPFNFHPSAHSESILAATIAVDALSLSLSLWAAASKAAHSCCCSPRPRGDREGPSMLCSKERRTTWLPSFSDKRDVGKGKSSWMEEGRRWREGDNGRGRPWNVTETKTRKTSTRLTTTTPATTTSQKKGEGLKEKEDKSGREKVLGKESWTWLNNHVWHCLHPLGTWSLPGTGQST